MGSPPRTVGICARISNAPVIAMRTCGVRHRARRTDAPRDARVAATAERARGFGARGGWNGRGGRGARARQGAPLADAAHGLLKSPRTTRRVRLPITVLYRPPKLAWLDPLMRAGRGRNGVRLAPANRRGVREVFAALKRREAVGFLPDQVPSAGKANGNLSSANSLTRARLRRSSPAAGRGVFLAYAERLPRGGYRMALRPPYAAPG